MTSVYVIASDSGPVKVGISNRPTTRLVALRNNTHRRLWIAYTEEFSDIRARTVELEAHTLLSHKKAYGEWFNVSVDEAVGVISTVARRIRNKPSRLDRNQEPAQIRAARALLNWSLETLATAAGVHRNTISNFETGRYAGDPDKLAAVRSALETAGVQFIVENCGGAGVRLARPSVGEGA